MHRAAVLVGRLTMYPFHVFPKDRLFPAVYNYPPLNSTQSYLPPRQDHAGDTTCDCNTVMYMYEVQTP